VSGWWIASTALLWIAVVALALVVLALARQIGVLLERVAPAGALTLTGLGAGDPAPQLELGDLRGRRLRIGGARADGRSTLLLFLSPSCPICETLLPVVRSLAREERGWLELVLASDGDGDHAGFAGRAGLGDVPYVVSRDLGLRFQVGKLPYAVLIDGAGRIAALGLVNTREHLESLIEAHARGVGSIQEYAARERRLEVAR
jgi:methylamine dehydrogenase accessory protein MauD